jgi:hypothetical protein
MRLAFATLLPGALASLSSAILHFNVCAASANEPLKLADSQLEPVNWTELAGWPTDDHLAAFSVYQPIVASCSFSEAARVMRE